MFIDSHNGNISFPNGFIVTSKMTQKQFRASSFKKNAKSYYYNTLPFLNFSLTAGMLCDYPLNVELGFYAQRLVGVSFWVDLRPEATSWADYSLEIERQSQAMHDRMLCDDLGEPHEILECNSYPGGDAESLNKSIRYTFSWGTVLSGHNERDGNTLISLQYSQLMP